MFEFFITLFRNASKADIAVFYFCSALWALSICAGVYAIFAMGKPGRDAILSAWKEVTAGYTPSWKALMPGSKGVLSNCLVLAVLSVLGWWLTLFLFIASILFGYATVGFWALFAARKAT
jgi:UPF0716 family protein affecting phage T7 exclusion